MSERTSAEDSGAAPGGAGAPAVGADEVVAEYLEAREAGRPIDPEVLLRRHPLLAEELREFFEDDRRVSQALRRLQPAPPAAPPAASDEPAPPGPRMFGDYELLEEIGRGGMGLVYKARQVSLNRPVALKMILSGQLASADEVKRFLVEAGNAANLDHPNIVPVYQVGCHAGQHYFTMKLEDRSLAQDLARFAGDVRASAALVAAVARAVHFAHQRGVLHRDLKPANILLDARGQPRVTDFGLARKLGGDSTLTQSGAILGSPRYMSPEQARGQKSLTVAADVYGLGAILYELLTGHPPFQSPSALETLQQVRDAEPARPSAVEPRVDSDLETICLKCLEKDPQRRYGSAEAVADDLERWLRHEPIEARPANPVVRLRHWCRTHRTVVAVIATLAIGLAAALVLLKVVADEREAKSLALWEASSAVEEKTLAQELLQQSVTNKIEAMPPIIDDKVRVTPPLPRSS